MSQLCGRCICAVLVVFAVTSCNRGSATTGSAAGFIVAVDIASGHEIWRSPASMAAPGAPAVQGEHLLVAGCDDFGSHVQTTDVFELSTGAPISSISETTSAYCARAPIDYPASSKLPGEFIPPPGFPSPGSAHGLEYVYSNRLDSTGMKVLQIVALVPDTAEERWRSDIGTATPRGGGPLPISDSVFLQATVFRKSPAAGVETFRLIVALDAATGAERWRFESASNAGSGSDDLFAVAGELAVQSDTSIGLLDAGTGQLIWERTYPEASGMVVGISDSVLYLGVHGRAVDSRASGN